jgi:hypothetical protein
MVQNIGHPRWENYNMCVVAVARAALDSGEHLAPSHVHDGQLAKGCQHTAHLEERFRSVIFPPSAYDHSGISESWGAIGVSLPDRTIPDRMNRNAKASVVSTIGTTINHESPTKSCTHITQTAENGATYIPCHGHGLPCLEPR